MPELHHRSLFLGVTADWKENTTETLYMLYSSYVSKEKNGLVNTKRSSAIAAPPSITVHTVRGGASRHRLTRVVDSICGGTSLCCNMVAYVRARPLTYVVSVQLATCTAICKAQARLKKCVI